MRVLVVDDEPLIRLGLVSLVEDWGYEAVEASDAAGAIRMLESTSIDFVITDVDMPGSMDGLALARYVSGRWPPIKLIVVSGKVRAEDASMPEGARFLSKPYQDEVLLASIRDMYQG
jgi:CheY-like chemotaxis protein